MHTRVLSKWKQSKKIIDFNLRSADYIGYASRDEVCVFVVFQMREGKLVDSLTFHSKLPGYDDENLHEFILHFYSGNRMPPNNLYTSSFIADRAILQKFFKEKLGITVGIHPPDNKKHAAILRMATENARHELQKHMRESGAIPALKELSVILQLPNIPLSIDGFDIAQVAGRHTVAAMVNFINGVPNKPSYRHFRIRHLPEGKIDDFAAIREVIARRYTRVKNERLHRPHLILIDGGKGAGFCRTQYSKRLTFRYSSYWTCQTK